MHYDRMLQTDIDLRAVREKIGDSQADFGARLGVNQSTVHRWETRGLPKHGTARNAVEKVVAELKPEVGDATSGS